MTHWIDDRKLVLTTAQRDSLGADYQAAYNVPCIKVGRKIRPLHVCPRCNGSGNEPAAEYDACDECRGSGGLAESRT